jgi:hypothetical protein
MSLLQVIGRVNATTTPMGQGAIKLTILHLEPLNPLTDDFNQLTVHMLSVILAFKRATSHKKPEAIAAEEKKVRPQPQAVASADWLGSSQRYLSSVLQHSV